MTHSTLAAPCPDEQGFASRTAQVNSIGGLEFHESVSLSLPRYPSAADPREEFLAMVVHELRSPLSGIQMAVELLRDPQSCDHSADRLWTGLDRALSHLAGLSDDLLELFQSTHPSFPLRQQTVDLAAEAYRSVERRRPDFEDAGLWVALESRRKPVLISADPRRLELILGNLLDNAAKYTETGGHVTVTVAVEESQAVLRIRDTGVGISAECLPNVFNPFVRDRAPSNRQVKGSGVGLLLVRKLVEQHGGQVEAHSPGRGLGSTFVIHLPLLDSPHDDRAGAGRDCGANAKPPAR